jgi:hypothetical protein
VSGQGQEKARGATQVKARGEMLKQVQHDFKFSMTFDSA